jgi:hypothetical protein
MSQTNILNPCTPYIQPIEESECLNDSLTKINNNFENLERITCDLKNKIDSLKTVRTFFYYGVNAQTNLQRGIVSRPSDQTIYNFINNENQLNLPAISYLGDIAYVIYQKTGFYNSLTPGAQVYDPIPGLINNPNDLKSEFAPVFVIWKYDFDGYNYLKASGFPKFTRNTQSTPGGNWNIPGLTTWGTYESWNE